MVSTIGTELAWLRLPRWLRMAAAARTTQRPTTAIRSALANTAAWLSRTTAE